MIRKSFEELMIYDVLSKKNNLDWMLLQVLELKIILSFQNLKI